MKKYLLIFLLSFIAFWGIAALRGGYVTILGITGFPLSSLVGFIVMLILTLFGLLKWKQTKPWKTMLSVWLGISILEIPARLFIPGALKSSLASLPSYLSWCFGILAGYFFYLLLRLSSKKRLLTIPALFIICFVWLWGGVLGGYDVFHHKLNFGTFDGKISEIAVKEVPQFNDYDRNSIALTDLPEDYVIMDFWYSGCGVCYKKFPIVEKLYVSYQADEKVGVYSVFCRLENETVTTGNEILSQRGYTFPNICIDMSDPILKELGVELFPTVLIFDKDRKLVFRGNIEFAEKFLAKTLSKN